MHDMLLLERGAACCPRQDPCRSRRTACAARFVSAAWSRGLAVVFSMVPCPSFGRWFHPRVLLAVRKAIVRPFSSPSSPTIKTPMKTAANLPIVKFSGGEDGRSGRFRGWTFRVSAGEVLAGGAASRPASKSSEGATPPMGAGISNWRPILAAVDCQRLAVGIQPFAQLFPPSAIGPRATVRAVAGGGG